MPLGFYTLIFLDTCPLLGYLLKTISPSGNRVHSHEYIIFLFAQGLIISYYLPILTHQEANHPASLLSINGYLLRKLI